MNQMPQCWCGNKELVEFSPGYLKCADCETLVSTHSMTSELGKVTDEETDLYGRNYWFSHQEKDLGLENIIARSRTDLAERCLYWLHTVLKYKPPPGKVLELGSAHGGFVALLRQSGFDATGLEISPWVANFARETFGVPMLLGPIEDQHMAPGELDVIVLMDVLEHLQKPIKTIRFCLELLKPDGIVVIQTPRYPENTTFEEMATRHDRFLEMLQENEHLYLFSGKSISKVFRQLGMEQIRFEPAIFSYYDMFFVVSRVPIVSRSKEEIEENLVSTPRGRVIQALLDINQRLQQLSSRLREAEVDRAARLDQINELTLLLQKSEADRAARLDQINELTLLLQKSEADRLRRPWKRH